MGPIPLTWNEIALWSHMTAHELDPWEAETLFKLSQEYARQYSDAMDATCPPPWTPDVEEKRSAVSEQLGKILDSLMLSRKRKPHA